jgi:hypothetical protein
MRCMKRSASSAMLMLFEQAIGGMDYLWLRCLDRWGSVGAGVTNGVTGGRSATKNPAQGGVQGGGIYSPMGSLEIAAPGASEPSRGLSGGPSCQGNDRMSWGPTFRRIAVSPSISKVSLKLSLTLASHTFLCPSIFLTLRPGGMGFFTRSRRASSTCCRTPRSSFLKARLNRGKRLNFSILGDGATYFHAFRDEIRLSKDSASAGIGVSRSASDSITAQRSSAVAS